MDYIANTDSDRREMLDSIGVETIEALLTAVPSEIRLKNGYGMLPAGSDEISVKKNIAVSAAKNFNADEFVSFLGGGIYDHYSPAAVSRLAGRAEFYTSYTPYQAEVSQGVLQALYEFQTMIAEITGMEAANASMYDGGSALAEAVLMGLRIGKKRKILYSAALNPFYMQVVKTYCSGLDIEFAEIPLKNGVTDPDEFSRLYDNETAAVVIQQPNFFGCIEDVEAFSGKCFYIVSYDPLSCGVLRSPGEFGADAVVGEGQGLGGDMYAGGPALGFFASKDKYIRNMPGRIVGRTTDNKGQQAFCLTLQTREQHIKRERATSNICTNESLNAITASVYMTLLGKNGFAAIGETILAKAHYAFEKLTEKGVGEAVFSSPFFKEFVLKFRLPAEDINTELKKHKIIGGLPLLNTKISGHDTRNMMLFAVTEKRTKADIDKLADIIGKM